MTFDWRTAVMFMKVGRKIRSKNWYFGNYLRYDGCNFVDNGGVIWNDVDIEHAKKHMEWELYIDFIHSRTSSQNF